MAVSFPSIFSSIWNYERPCFKELEEITIQPEELQPPPETLEILCRIFSNFALNSKEMVSVSRVCKAWYIASQNLFIPFSQLKKVSFLNHYEIEQWKKQIRLRNQQLLESLEIIRKSRHLKKLDLSKTFVKDKQIDILVSIPFSSLEKIFFHHCPILERPNFSGIRARELSIQQCPFLKEMTFQNVPTELQKIVVKRCKKLSKIIINGMPSLLSVKISHCKKVENIRIHNLDSMDEIAIAGCIQLKTIRLRNLPSLQKLKANKCDHLTRVILKKTPSIKEIKIYYCKKLAPFNLSEVHALGCLILKQCETLNSYFTELTSQKLRDVFQLHNLDSLQDIYVKSPVLKNVSVEGMKGLTALVIEESPSLVNVVFEGPSPLKYLCLVRCKHLKTLNLKRLSSLQELYLDDCKKLWDVHLQGLESIQKISMKNCDPYTALQAAYQTKSIQLLFHSMSDLFGCQILD